MDRFVDWVHSKRLSAHTFVVTMATIVGIYSMPEVHEAIGPFLSQHSKIAKVIVVALAIYARYAPANNH